MNNNYSILKKQIQKAIMNELQMKEMIDFYQCSSIIKKLEEDITKLENELDKNKSNIIVKIPI